MPQVRAGPLMRHYRAVKGFWAIGYTRWPGSWSIHLGRHVWTTEPPSGEGH